MINFQTSPDKYKHWKLKVEGPIATLTMDVQEDETLAEGYKLKLNSYDLGVDIELADAIQRLRFEHPNVKAVVVTSLKPRIFCAGANIYMLGTSSHAFKVNFCKFTNETRCAIEDDSHNSGRRYIAALNGTASGGGYELGTTHKVLLRHYWFQHKGLEGHKGHEDYFYCLASGGLVLVRRMANHRAHGEHGGRFRYASCGWAKVW
jgi:benzoyl-CoA-dihydrodiol lyase